MSKPKLVIKRIERVPQKSTSAPARLDRSRFFVVKIKGGEFSVIERTNLSHQDSDK